MKTSTLVVLLIASVTWVGGTPVLPQSSRMSFEPAINIFVEDSETLAVGDFNNDGILDIVTGGDIPGLSVFPVEANFVIVLLGRATSKIAGSSFQQVQVTVGDDPEALAIGDLNNDGYLDIVTANEDSDDVSVVLGNGNGSFQPQRTFFVGDLPDEVALADVNSDGILDILTPNDDSNDVSVLLGRGDGTFANQIVCCAGVDADSIAVGDFNGDGVLDLVVTNDSADSISVVLGNGDGTFGLRRDFLVGDDPEDVEVGDLNGDGILDIVTVNQESDDVSVLLGRGDGAFRRERRFSAGTESRRVALADMNGDNILDIVTANNGDDPDEDTVSVLLGRGNGTFRIQQEFFAGNNPEWVVVADMNLDGLPDIVVANDGFRDVVSILLQKRSPDD